MMKVHTSNYEQEGWIDINKTKPDPKKKIRLAQIHIVDWNLERMNWQTEGWILEGGTFSLKKCAGLDIKSSHPTHWQEIN